MLDEHDGLERAAALGREGVDQHLDRGVEHAEDRHPQQHRVAPAQHAPPHHVAGDGAHGQDDGDRGQEAEPRHHAPEDLEVHRGEEVVDLAPEDPQDPAGHEDRQGHEDAGDEPDLEPVLHAGAVSHATSMMTRRGPIPKRPSG